MGQLFAEAQLASSASEVASAFEIVEQVNPQLAGNLAAEGVIDFDVDVPEGAVFLADVGLRALQGEDDPHPHPHAERSRLAVSVARRDRFHRLEEARVLTGEHKGTWWTPLEVDLSDYGGERVTLRLELIPDAPVEPGRMAFWGSPRIALASGAAE